MPVNCLAIHWTVWNSQPQCYSGPRTPTCVLYSVQNAESLAWWFLFNKMAKEAQFETIILARAWILSGYDVCLVYALGLKWPQVCIAENSQMSHGIMSWPSVLSSMSNPLTGQNPDWKLHAKYRSNCPDWKEGRIQSFKESAREVGWRWKRSVRVKNTLSSTFCGEGLGEKASPPSTLVIFLSWKWTCENSLTLGISISLLL